MRTKDEINDMIDIMVLVGLDELKNKEEDDFKIGYTSGYLKALLWVRGGCCADMFIPVMTVIICMVILTVIFAVIT